VVRPSPLTDPEGNIVSYMSLEERPARREVSIAGMVPLLQHGAAGAGGRKAGVRQVWRLVLAISAADRANSRSGGQNQTQLPDPVGREGEKSAPRFGLRFELRTI